MSRWVGNQEFGSSMALVPLEGSDAGAGAAQGGNEAFVTYGRGILKVFNVAKDFGFISPIFRSEDSEGPPLNLGSADGLWFFSNHNLPTRAVPGCELTFEIWENSQGKSQARNVQLAAELTLAARPEERVQEFHQAAQPKRHQNEPKVIYPSVYVSDVPVEYSENSIRDLHKQLGLNPDTIMGLKYLPFTEVSLGGGDGQQKVAPVTGAVIIRYVNDEAANAAVDRLKGHPVRTSKGITKHLGAKHAAPAKWVVQRRQEEEHTRKKDNSRGESLRQKVRGFVTRVSMSGFGVIKSAEWGEVMWRQYELPTNIRTLQFADKVKFNKEVEHRSEYKRLKEMEGKQVEAELYKLPDGQVRAWHVRVLAPHGELENDGGAYPQAALPASAPPPAPAPAAEPQENAWSAPSAAPPQGHAEGGPPGPPGMPGMPPGMMPPPGGPGGLPPGLPPGMPPEYYQQMMAFMQNSAMMPKKEKKKDKKEKKEKKRRRSSSGDRSRSAPPRRRTIDDNDF
eukprot:TRINITY_DN71588_c0_g1_i1.p1 TRINITY_DN71588_c0_g1~~TRINITY_DN71588_c0_g1_i1.p1  ORF type:complete len:508 (-),score=125.33 TRINITY_DN71588_c0_g1_i1:30-1553(-)